ncbi:MAG TPA: hypothetical protein VGG09_14700 [Acidimicrobiales bacterium]
MSTLELAVPDDAEMLELLEGALFEDVAPPTAALASYEAALDERFGDEPHQASPLALPDPIPLRRRIGQVTVAVAAGIVALAIGLAWYGSPGTPQGRSALSRIEYATTAVRLDLTHDASAQQTAQDVTTLARLLSQSPGAQHAQGTPEADRTISEACRHLALPTATVRAPSLAQLPAACRPTGTAPSTDQGALGTVPGLTLSGGKVPGSGGRRYGTGFGGSVAPSAGGTGDLGARAPSRDGTSTSSGPDGSGASRFGPGGADTRSNGANGAPSDTVPTAAPGATGGVPALSGAQAPLQGNGDSAPGTGAHTPGSPGSTSASNPHAQVSTPSPLTNHIARSR